MKVVVEIVLPCYNPDNNWFNELSNFNEFAKQQYNLSYIVVNDGTEGNIIENQIEILRSKGVSINYIYYSKNRGKGYALRQGVAQTKADYVLYTDIDFPFTNQSTYELIDVLVKGKHDIVAGSRNQNYYQKNISGFRKILSKAFRYFLEKTLKMPVSDTQCGLKGFNDVGKKIFLSTTINRYLFDFEFIYKATKDKSTSIGTVDVELKDNVVLSKMRLKILIQETLNLFLVLVKQ